LNLLVRGHGAARDLNYVGAFEHGAPPSPVGLPFGFGVELGTLPEARHYPVKVRALVLRRHEAAAQTAAAAGPPERCGGGGAKGWGGRGLQGVAEAGLGGAREAAEIARVLPVQVGRVLGERGEEAGLGRLRCVQLRHQARDPRHLHALKAGPAFVFPRSLRVGHEGRGKQGRKVPTQRRQRSALHQRHRPTATTAARGEPGLGQGAARLEASEQPEPPPRVPP